MSRPRHLLPHLIAVGLLLGSFVVWMGAAGAQTDESAGLRIVHAGIDTPPVNVSVAGETVAEDLFWLEATDYLDVQAGDHEIAVFDPEIGLDEALASATVTVEAGKNYSAVITGELPEPEIVLIEDGDEAGVDDGMAAVRVFHSVPDAGTIDAAGSDGTILAEGVDAQSVSDYVMVEPGAYDVEIREAGTGAVLHTESGLTLEAGEFQTVYLSGLAELENFAAEPIIDEARAAEEQAGPTPTEADATPTEAAEEPEPTATEVPEPALPSTGAGGTAAGGGVDVALYGALALMLLAAGGGLLFWTRRAA